MSETFWVADTHLDHDAIRRHCKRPFDTLDAMNQSIASIWNGIVSNKDLVYIVGDFAWRNHRKWINELNGRKVLIVGSHDQMPQDVLDLFQGELTEEKKRLAVELHLTKMQFREVHTLLDRVICGQRMTLCHCPMVSWNSSVHGAWCIHGHCHGRRKESLPGRIGGGLILDVGWDIWKKPINFDELRCEMKIKLDMMPQGFRDHVLKGTPLIRIDKDESDTDSGGNDVSV